ncbi:MAG: 6-bladed beta-propeller [Tannerellaceae bacterium]
MKRHICLFVMGLAAYACSSDKQNSLESIDVIGALDQVTPISVSDLGKTVSYVPLETSDESLIGKNAYIRMLNDRLIVGSYEQPLKMFDRKSGRFIANIGSIGQGPGEYTLQEGIPVCWVDNATKTIYVQSSANKLLRFDINGQPLSSLDLPKGFPPVPFSSVIANNDNLLAYQSTCFSKPEYKIVGYNTKTNQLQNRIANDNDSIAFSMVDAYLPRKDYRSIPVSTGTAAIVLKDKRVVYVVNKEPAVWSFGNDFYFKENFNDTIYQVTEGELTPKRVFALGDKTITPEAVYNTDAAKNKLAINYVLEGDDALFFSLEGNYFHLTDYKRYWGVYNKKDKSVKITDTCELVDPEKNVYIEQLHSATPDGAIVGLIDTYTCMEDGKNKNAFNVKDDDNPIAVIIE